MTADSGEKLAKRRAIEALRNGVPNSEAVRILGCNQPRAEERFEELLAGEASTPGTEEDLSGILVSGGFGEGKSHLLTHFQGLALEQGYVCSRVVISKETPLLNRDKVFKAAVGSALVPGRSGRLVENLDLRSKADTAAYGNFFGWASNESRCERLNGIFTASLIAYEHLENPEMKSRIEGFWSGDRLHAADLKRSLRELGQKSYCAFRAPRLTALPPQRLRFMARMIKGAGYKGWVVLLDEIELIGFYSMLQRSRSYAELAKWLSKDSDGDSGLITVGAVTDDFASVVISAEGRKKDTDKMLPWLSERTRWEHIRPGAARGMQLLESSCMRLESPTQADLDRSMDNLRLLYSEAYDWDAPPAADTGVGGVGFQRRMRYKVRAAINSWDLQRLGLATTETEAEGFGYSYDEREELEPGSDREFDSIGPSV